ncbi:MAG TPA: MazG nucleotide pyrophosphohydrolase domain-containing protein, partial [Armatimonadota bacterium]|nr:MazG nucleotide pyrophosphohydrolase domain-containing protein [Armatimonadota bacterium]
HEELNELLAEIRSGDTERAREEIGDLLFAVVNLARRLHIDAEEALRRMVDRFSARFRAMEAMAAEDGRVLPDLSAEEWDAYWERAKSNE